MLTVSPDPFLDDVRLNEFPGYIGSPIRGFSSVQLGCPVSFLLFPWHSGYQLSSQVGSEKCLFSFKLSGIEFSGGRRIDHCIKTFPGSPAFTLLAICEKLRIKALVEASARMIFFPIFKLLDALEFIKQTKNGKMVNNGNAKSN